MKSIEVRPGQLAATHLVHGGLVPPAPSVGEGGPVYVKILFSAELLAFPDYRVTPIHHRTEDIESEGLDIREGHTLHPLSHWREPRFLRHGFYDFFCFRRGGQGWPENHGGNGDTELLYGELYGPYRRVAVRTQGHK